eukprot:1161470-Pelagomonas_calceolata.AAC.10
MPYSTTSCSRGLRPSERRTCAKGSFRDRDPCRGNGVKALFMRQGVQQIQEPEDMCMCFDAA